MKIRQKINGIRSETDSVSLGLITLHWMMDQQIIRFMWILRLLNVAQVGLNLNAA